MKKPEKKVYCDDCKHDGRDIWGDLYFLDEYNGKCGNGFLQVKIFEGYNHIRTWFFPMMSKANALNNCPFYRPTFKKIIKNIFGIGD